MIVAVYKEEGLTSRQVVNQIENLTGEKKVGHAGTLDPLATGVLVIGIGRSSTKKLHTSLFFEKTYLATVMLGESSSTDDREGELTIIDKTTIPCAEKIKTTLGKLTGEIMQSPPAYSAVKINGKEAYKYARKGKALLPLERKVFIKEIKLLDYSYPLLQLEVITGKGAYIRSLARDIGRILETGGYLYALERTRVGEFSKEDCVPLSFFENFKNCDSIS